MLRKIYYFFLRSRIVAWLFCLLGFLKKEILSPNKKYFDLNGYYLDTNNSAIISQNKLSNYKDGIDVIVPVFNVESYLCECLNSLYLQKTSFPCHFLIIDDGSTDTSGSICDEFAKKDSRFIVIHTGNQGASAARNTGLNASYFRYIMFLDSDDCLIDSNILQKCYNLAIRKQDNILIQFGFTNKLYKKVKNQQNHSIYGMPWGKLYSHHLFDYVRFPTQYWFEDSIISFLIYPLSDRVIYLDDVGYFYRKRKDSLTALSRKSNPKNLDTFYITRRLMIDRAILGFENDKNYANKMIRQAAINAKRLENEPINVQKEVFRLTCKLFSEYEISHKVDKKYNKMRVAISNYDFGRYKLFSKLI